MRARPYYYMLFGTKPIPTDNMIEWAEWFQTANRRVNYTVVRKGIGVSTVFLGLDHNFSGEGEPILFETMIFGDSQETENMEDWCYRYHTWEEAEKGHQEMIKRVLEYLATNKVTTKN